MGSDSQMVLTPIGRAPCDRTRPEERMRVNQLLKLKAIIGNQEEKLRALSEKLALEENVRSVTQQLAQVTAKLNIIFVVLCTTDLILPNTGAVAVPLTSYDLYSLSTKLVVKVHQLFKKFGFVWDIFFLYTVILFPISRIERNRI